ncbi:hypothetical protein RI367_008569 [Sorochytrium milnesiophthora]
MLPPTSLAADNIAPSQPSMALVLLYAYPILVTIAPPAISHFRRDSANETADMMLLLLLTVYLGGLLKVPWDLHRLTCRQLAHAILTLDRQCHPHHKGKAAAAASAATVGGISPATAAALASATPSTTSTSHSAVSKALSSSSSIHTLRLLSHLYLFLTCVSPFLGGWIIHVTKTALPASSSLRFIHPAHFIFASSLLPLFHLSNMAKDNTARVGKEADAQAKSASKRIRTRTRTRSGASLSSSASSSSSPRLRPLATLSASANPSTSATAVGAEANTAPHSSSTRFFRQSMDMEKRQVEQTKQIIALEKAVGMLTRRLDRLYQVSAGGGLLASPANDSKPHLSLWARLQSYALWAVSSYVRFIITFLLLPITVTAWSLRRVRWLMSDTSALDEVKPTRRTPTPQQQQQHHHLHRRTKSPPATVKRTDAAVVLSSSDLSTDENDGHDTITLPDSSNTSIHHRQPHDQHYATAKSPAAAKKTSSSSSSLHHFHHYHHHHTATALPGTTTASSKYLVDITDSAAASDNSPKLSMLSWPNLLASRWWSTLSASPLPPSSRASLSSRKPVMVN